MNKKELFKIRTKLIAREYPIGANPTLIAVSKKVDAATTYEAYLSGLRDFGESRVQDLEEKARFFQAKGIQDIRWHFIGHLQSNKLNKLLKVPNLFAIHSIDSMSLLEKLYAKEEELSGPLYYFIQMNTSGENEKTGLNSFDELMPLLNLALSKSQSKIQLKGLMTMSRLRTDDFAADARFCFSQLKTCKEQVERDFGIDSLKTSMGMSQDYPYALEYGADYLRIGSTLFAPDPNEN